MYEDHKNMNLKRAVQMAAPHTWPAAVGPCLVAGALVLRRTGSVSILMWTALMLICILMQSAANIFNDYFDLLRGTDQVSDYVEKNDAVLVHNNIPPGQALVLGIAVLVSTLLIAVYPVATGGITVLAVGITGALILVGYSAGPIPLSSLPIGELAAGFTMGSLIPLACTCALTGDFMQGILIDSLPLLIGIALMMMTNNICDIEKDSRVYRKTLAVLLGRKRARTLYRVLLFLWGVLLVVYLGLRFAPASMKNVGIWLLLAALGSWGIRSLFVQMRLDLEPPCRPYAMKGIARLNGILSFLYFLWLMTG